MDWKKQFARNVRFNELPSIGPFNIEQAPEPLGKGKFRCTLVLKTGGKAQLTTFEGTIGDIIAKSIDGKWVEAYNETVGKESYVRFRTVA